MSREQGTIEVDDVKYSVSQYTATKGNKLFLDLLKFAGPHLMEFLTEGDLMEQDAGNMKKAFASFFMSLDSEVADSLIKRIFSGMQIYKEGKIQDLNFELDFQGKYGHMYKVIFEVLKFQYSDFLELAKDAMPFVSAAKPGTIKAI